MSNINEFSTGPISAEELVNWPRIAAIASMVSFSLPTFVTGLEVYNALSVVDTLYAIAIASIILTIIGGTMATIGVRTRMSSYLLVRVAFGDIGAGVINIAFAISLLGWFGVNIDLFSQAFQALLISVGASPLSNWLIECLAGLCMVATTIYGFRAINLLATLMVPILAIVTFWLLFAAFNEITIGEFWAYQKEATKSVNQGVNAIVGAIIIGAIILPDICRFSRQSTGGINTAVWAYLIVELIVLLVTAFAAAAMGKTEILELLLSLGIGLGAFFLVIAGSWVLNSLNLYSTVLSTEATFPKLDSRLLTIVLGGIGIIAAFLNILDVFLTFLSFLAALFVPVAGIIIIDYWWLRRAAYQFTVFENNISISKAAIVAWLIGALVSVLDMFGLAASLSGISVLDAILLSGGSYYLLSKWLGASVQELTPLQPTKPGEDL